MTPYVTSRMCKQDFRFYSELPFIESRISFARLFAAAAGWCDRQGRTELYHHLGSLTTDWIGFSRPSPPVPFADEPMTPVSEPVGPSVSQSGQGAADDRGCLIPKVSGILTPGRQ